MNDVVLAASELWNPAPIFALHALLRLGEPVLAHASPRLIERALQLRCRYAYRDGERNYVDFLAEALTCALTGGGAAALPHLASALVSSCRSQQFWCSLSPALGLKIVSNALAALPYVLGDVAAGDTAAVAFHDAIELTGKFLAFHDRSGSSTEEPVMFSKHATFHSRASSAVLSLQLP